ncbi:TonB-dependent receptor [Paucihalobacter ruber]|uniref:TonB-dependent receptor n=1 Tax=Paucihalobacter ruber TaxID=2567861 RepID=A0A506PNS5_9FLAO|nr:TonB-dependent receptor [Paucihalobacter ruber]TPV35566.1 TonB-dependent receptor [Paucihalobacter ruber]
MKIKLIKSRSFIISSLLHTSMRAIVFLLCTTVFSLNPTDSFSQEKVTIEADMVISIDEVFNLIQDQTVYRFLYPQDLFINSPKVALKKGTIEISSLLEKCFSGKDIKFKLSENNTIIIEKSEQQTTVNNTPQKLLVSGVVVEQNGQPLPGANILEKGTTNGTQTDIDGQFNLTVKDNSSTLVVSYIGYLTKEIVVNENTNFNIVLEESRASLEEVVVVGYGRQKKVTLTGAVSDIRTEEIKESKTANLANNLTGRIPGLVINARGGEPGSDQIDVRIRGIGTTGNTQPLYVIDGVPSRGSFERLNPDDIESISVLKDASAAIYGAQAANGVILVTTKRGKTGEPVFNYNMHYSLAQPTRRPHLMNAYQYLTWVDEINERNNRPQEFQDIIRQYRDGSIDRTKWGDTDWWDVVTDNWTPQVQHAINVSGGSENTQYYISGQYLNQDAIYVGDAYGYKQYNIRSNIDTRLGKNIKMGLDLAARIGDNNRPTLNTDGLVRQVFVQPPFEFPYFENGLIRKTSAGNPISLVNGDSGSKRTQTKKFDSKFALRWELPFITQGLYLDTYATVDFYTTTRKDLSKPFDQYEFDEESGEYINLKFQTGTINLFQQYSEELNQLFHFKIGYDKSYGKHSISSFVAYEQFKQEGEFIFASRQNLISEDIPFLFSGADENQNNGGRGYQSARQNFFGKINYNFDDKYLVDVTMRYDGSSNFAKGNRFGFFPAASLGWRVSEEDFFNSELITELKIRTSWGLLGNDRVNNFQFLQIYNIGNSYIFGEDPQRYNGLSPGTTPNPNITWETSQKLNFGVDFRLRNRLLEGSVDVFYERRSDILAPRNASIPVYAGLTLPDENIGKVSNRGVEIQLNHQNTINDFSYNFGGQFTFAESRIIFIDEPPNVPDWQRRTGRPVDFILIYEANGIYNNQEEIDNSVSFPDAQPGDVRIVDQNGDGVLNEQDQIILENSPTPKIVYGFTMGLDWKNLSLNVLFQGQALAQTIYRPFDINQQSQFYEERWRSEIRTPNATFPGAFDTASSSFREVSTVWIRNNSFLRLKNVDISYSLNKKWLEPLGLDSFRFFVSGHNLLILFDNVKINDPESVSSTGWFYPQQLLLTAGFNVTF